MPPVPIISVVIPSYNSALTIRQCLDSVINQFTVGPYEIIVVDSSDDQTPEILESYAPRVRYLHLDEKTIPAIARNIGSDHAGGTYIAFTDSDCIADGNWLQKIMQAHRCGYDVVCGSVINARSGNLISIAEYFLEFRELSEHLPRKENEFIPAGNFSIKADLFEETGKFPGIRASEDIFLSYNIRQKGIKILFEPKIRIRHVNRNRLGPFLKNQVTLGFSAAIIRRILPKSGAFLIKHPIYAVLIPAVKLIRTVQIVIRNRFPYNLLQLCGFLLSLPLFAAGVSAFSLGFSRGIRAPESVPDTLKENVSNQI